MEKNRKRKTVGKKTAGKKPLSRGAAKRVSARKSRAHGFEFPKIVLPKIHFPKIAFPEFNIPKFGFGGKRRKKQAAVSHQAVMTLSVIGAVVAIAGGLWTLQKPADVPTPVAAVATQVSQPAKVPEDRLHADFAEAAGFGMSERVNHWSKRIWKEKDLSEKLRVQFAGVQVDDSAPVIPEKYDCTTFVETVLAMARSNNSGEFFANLMTIRYKDGKPSFVNRNHFPELDWIPNNEKAGILKDTTSALADLAGVKSHVETKTIERGKWLAEQVRAGRANRAIASIDEKDAKEVHVPYIAFGDFTKVMRKIPTGTVLNLVRKSNPEQPVIITHQGFVIQEDGRTVIRHTTASGVIRNQDLGDYLEKLFEANKNWPMLGINLNQVSERG